MGNSVSTNETPAKIPKSIKLSYFDVYARGESIRFLLGHAKVKYEDDRIAG